MRVPRRAFKKVSSFTSWLKIRLTIPLYVYTVLLVHSAFDGHLGCFHLLATVNNAIINMDSTNSWVPDFSSFGSILWRGIAISWDNSMCNFLRNSHTVFQSGYTILYSYQQRTRIISSRSCQHFKIFILIIAVLMSLEMDSLVWSSVSFSDYAVM